MTKKPFDARYTATDEEIIALLKAAGLEHDGPEKLIARALKEEKGMKLPAKVKEGK